MTAPAYGYLHTARVHSLDPVTGGVFLQGVVLAPTSRWGPVATCVFGLQPGDQVVAASLGTSRDTLMVIGKVGDRLPDIGDIPGLVEALGALDGRLDVVEPLVSGHTTTLLAQAAAISANATAIAGKVSTSTVGQPSGVGSLDVTGKQPAGEVNAGVQLTSGKNAANGYAGLDASSKLTGSQQVYATSVGAVGSVMAAGAANTAARGDHTHLGDRTVWAVQRQDDATLGTAASTTKVTLHTVALTGLLASTPYRVLVKIPSHSTVSSDHVRVGLYKTSSATAALDQSTNERIFVGGGDVHNLLIDYIYTTGAAETAVTFVVAGWRETGTGTATFKAWNGMPYKFQVTQLGLAALNSF